MARSLNEKFPAERFWQLVEELYEILFDFFVGVGYTSLESIDRHRNHLALWFLDHWSRMGGFADDIIRVLASNIPNTWNIISSYGFVAAKKNLGLISCFFRERLLSFRNQPVWMQAILVCLWVIVTRRCQTALRQHMTRRHKKRRRRRLSMKTGHSEILQGRTSLVYGAAGDLMDEEYLDDAASGKESNEGGRRGRFGTFDFFGINTTTGGSSPVKRNWKSNQAFGEDYGRQRTRSIENLANASGAAIVRPRTDSMGSLSESLGDYFQAFAGHRENSLNPVGGRANLGRKSSPSQLNPDNDTTTNTPKTNNNIVTSGTPSKQNHTNHIEYQNTNEKLFTPTLRRERIGSMDIYYALGKNHLDRDGPTALNDEFGKSVTFPSWRDNLGSEGRSDNSVFEKIGDNNDVQYLYDEFGVVTLSHKVEYHGPFRPILNCGSSFVPPPPFDLVSRNKEIHLPLKRILKLDILKGTLNVIEPTTSAQNQKWDIVYENINGISIKFKQPLMGGVLFLYKKGTLEYGPDWKEHTFESAHAAAQFQLDLLAYQVLGKPLQHIFEALHLVHQGSLACTGQEFVFHDEIRGDGKGGENSKKGSSKSPDKTTHCVAWDDAMRAMSSIPTVRIGLERLWLSHKRPSEIRSKATKNSKDNSKVVLENDEVSSAELSLLKEEYIKNRLLLGPVDFYRLFVPTLPETALPEGDYNNRRRMEQLLCWRKRIARAAVLVRSYTRARLVANRGWNLNRGLPLPGTSAATGSVVTGSIVDHGSEQIIKRFAYDGNAQNHVHDVGAKNEIYEASVSRDVLCHVRPFDYLNDDDEDDDKVHREGIRENEEKSLNLVGLGDSHQIGNGDDHPSHKHFVLSPYQAYTYIETHYFKATEEMLDVGGPMEASRDPVEIFPSLRDILVRHPDLDFFVDCLSDPEDNIYYVNLHVRSLAKGIDRQFDNVIERFSHDTEENRKRKLYLMVQLGNWVGLSFFQWLFLKLLSWYLLWTEICRDSPMNLESTRDRYGFPGFRVGDLFKTYHFGGSLQTDSNQPKNYIGLTKYISASYYEKVLGKIVFDKLQRQFSESTVDLTFVIEGERNDELPERALSSLRIVHVNPNKVAKDPCPYLSAVKLEKSKSTDKAQHLSFSQPFSPLALHDAVQFSLDSVRSIVNSSIPLISMDKNEGPPMKVSHLEVIVESNEDGPLNTIQTNPQREFESVNPLDRGIDLVSDILKSVVVPYRQQPNPKFREDGIEKTGQSVMSQIAVLKMFDRDDIRRYVVGFDYNIGIASKRLVETAAWRGALFPIDKRRCRIELQNGQFFHHGFDKNNNPVFYFRNLCRGPWRGDSEAAILAILYRLDKHLKEFSSANPYTKATVVVLMGHAKRGARKKKNWRSQNESRSIDGNDKSENEDDFEVDDDSSAGVDASQRLPELPSEEEIKINTGNPRISTDEKWTCHTNKAMLRRLFKILMAHYPGRLSRILVVKGRGRNHYYRDHIQGKMVLRKLLSNIDKYSCREIMTKVQFVNKTSMLIQYISLKNLPCFVGGIAPIRPSAYEF
mmetsp:Transcript_16775/g.38749  ORF Transcript_16775/g.38749 Transcript_16775/m.38749 type:complete len:1535 (+) Transcript_16775:357-4961(+)|eukprot:CAMPEP_0197178374 /NCGR_PEP_ID=MMETSP1423-20130617/3668_1 /TAXON_ID=476441 /ORGANISM="Pseudo-nitzschia heimii, Strain UNC1101" /LENGTH=1534 /DNA_ID=CAMNT_0042628097 /DNA_START=324 /DNA_END=4928 /DNA_ORIENTATION=-